MSRERQRAFVGSGIGFLFLGLAAGAAFAQGAEAGAVETQPSSCVLCHTALDDEAMRAPVARWTADAHAQAGLGCVGCHGGDPDPALAEDIEAMSADRGYIGAPSRLEIPQFCARCHADAEYMKQFDPQGRVDQYAEYLTSAHGRANSAGDPVPATCIDCHGVHGILPVTSPDAPVYATKVANTCARCHAKTEVMQAYGLPTNQFEDYQSSVHGSALIERGDTAAPSCNDCHGNHGAAPPGVHSVARVCGQCHGREARLFQASIKRDLFDEMGMPECSTCHDHHRVLHPSPTLFHGDSAPQSSQGRVVRTLPLAVDVGPIDAGATALVSWTGVLHTHLDSDDERYAHSVEIVSGGEPLVLDATVRPGDRLAGQPPRRVERDGLVGELTVETYSGDPVRAGDALRYRLQLQAPASAAVSVRDVATVGVDPVEGSICLTCHEVGDTCDEATGRMFDAIVTLDRDIRSAGDLLHRAELAGMEVRDPQFQLGSEGTNAVVEARALIHAFDPDRLIARTDEGRKVAAGAMAAGEQAMGEIQYRRAGLAVSLGLVLLVLVALYLKIREVDRRRTAA